MQFVTFCRTFSAWESNYASLWCLQNDSEVKTWNAVNGCLWSLLSLHTDERLMGPSKENSAEHCLNVYRD